MILFALSVFSVATFGSCIAKELTFPICKRNSTDYSICLTQALRESWPLFIKGIPEFNLPSLDPLFYEYGEVTFDRGEIHGQTIFSNITALGLKKTHFFDARVHFLDDVFHMEIDIRIPKLLVDGICHAEGTLSGFKMTGQGYFNMTIEDVRGTWDIKGPVANDTWTIEHFRNAPTVGKLSFYTKDLFGDSKEINDVAVTFINEYWPPIYRTALPFASDTWESWLVDICNRFFSKISFSKLFPEN